MNRRLIPNSRIGTGQRNRLKLSLFEALSYSPDPNFPHYRFFRFGIPLVLKRSRFPVSTESDALRFLHCTDLGLPIPSLIDTFRLDGQCYTVMTRIPGRTLYDLVRSKEISNAELDVVVDDLKDVVLQLWTIQQKDFPDYPPGMVACSASGHGLPNPLNEFEDLAGPLSLSKNYVYHTRCISDDVGTWCVEHLLAQEPVQARSVIDDTIVWVHCDLRPMNILVDAGRLSGVIDWENSGWHPRHWQLLIVRRWCATNPPRVVNVWKRKDMGHDVEEKYKAGINLVQHLV